MATIIGTSGAFKDLQDKLREHRAYVPSTVEDLLNFSKEYTTIQRQLYEKHKQQLEAELNREQSGLDKLEAKLLSKLQRRKLQLLEEKQKLEARINSTSSSRWILNNYFAQIDTHFDKRRLNSLMNSFEDELHKPFKNEKRFLLDLSDKLARIKSNFEKTVTQRVQSELSSYSKAEEILKQHKTLISGTIGEARAIEILATLPESFTVLNDVRIRFNPGYRRKSHNDFIASAQIDHMIIGPAGIFVVETKHWSQGSIDSLNLRSPVEQLIRTGYAIYRFSQDNLRSAFEDHWGSRKIPVSNILLMTNVPVQHEYEWIEVHHISSVCDSLVRRRERMTPQAVRETLELFRQFVQ